MSIEIKKIAVCGAGAMGLGIAQVFAQNNFQVTLFDIQEKQVFAAKNIIEKNWQVATEKGKMNIAERSAAEKNITYSNRFEDLQADLIIEAAIESLEIKHDIFLKLAAQNSTQTILVSNTSSLSITKIAKGIPQPERFAGLHFFNPAHLMKLVEVIAGENTDKETITALCLLCEKIGKQAVVCNDSPGFIVNRVARHYYLESLKIAEEQVADMQTIDSLLESSGFKMGAFKLMDVIGNDVNFAVTTSLFNDFHFEPRFRPSLLQKQKVDAGQLGKKSGKGFYQYI